MTSRVAPDDIENQTTYTVMLDELRQAVLHFHVIRHQACCYDA